MSRIDRLVVIWREPSPEGTRHVIGHLARGVDGHAFWYDEHALDVARQRGFSPLPAFSDWKLAADPYRARHLFGTFAGRLPSPARSDFGQMIKEWGVLDVDDPFEILARSGAVTMTDRLEVAEHREASDDLSRPLEFRVAGQRFRDKAAQIEVGDKLELRHSPHDTDDCATLVIARTGEPAGYVPRQYSAMFSGLLASGVSVDATAVRRLVLPAEAGRWVVRAQRS